LLEVTYDQAPNVFLFSILKFRNFHVAVFDCRAAIFMCSYRQTYVYASYEIPNSGPTQYVGYLLQVFPVALTPFKLICSKNKLL